MSVLAILTGVRRRAGGFLHRELYVGIDGCKQRLAEKRPACDQPGDERIPLIAQQWYALQFADKSPAAFH